MAHDLDLHDSWRQAPPNEAGVLCRTDDEHECLFDAREATTTTETEREMSPGHGRIATRMFETQATDLEWPENAVAAVEPPHAGA